MDAKIRAEVNAMVAEAYKTGQAPSFATLSILLNGLMEQLEKAEAERDELASALVKSGYHIAPRLDNWFCYVNHCILCKRPSGDGHGYGCAVGLAERIMKQL